MKAKRTGLKFKHVLIGAFAVMTIIPASIYGYSANEVSDKSSVNGAYHVKTAKEINDAKRQANYAKFTAQQDTKEIKVASAAPPIVSKNVENKAEVKADKQSNDVEYETEETYESGEVYNEASEDDVNTNYNYGNALIYLDNPDYNYYGQSYYLDEYSRMYIEGIVMREAGNQGFEGCALVAQCLRDALVDGGYGDVYSMANDYGYAGDTPYIPNQDVLDAVSYIFDQGGMAVQHRILFYYAYSYSHSDWHETQLPVICYGDQKFFDRWY